MELTQEVINKIQEAMKHTKKDGSVNWKDGDEIEVNLAGTFAADRFIVIKNRTKDPVVSAEPHPHFDYEKKVFTKDGREEGVHERTGGVKEMSEEELQEQIIQQIEVLVEELGGNMCHSVRCNSMGRQSKVIEIEYDVEEKNS